MHRCMSYNGFNFSLCSLLKKDILLGVFCLRLTTPSILVAAQTDLGIGAMSIRAVCTTLARFQIFTRW